MSVPTRNQAPRMSGMDLYAALEAVRDEYGELTGETLVKAATPADHPLHPRFEWNDKIAAHKYRVEQGNELIRTVMVEFVDASGAPQKVRAYVSVRTGPRPVYAPTREVAENPALAAAVLQMAEMEWRRFLARYGHLKEFMEQVAAAAAAKAA